jgi:hypothetical protein
MTDAIKNWMYDPNQRANASWKWSQNAYDKYFAGDPKYGRQMQGAVGDLTGAVGNYGQNFGKMADKYGFDFNQLLGGQQGEFTNATENARQAMINEFMTGMTKAKRDLFQPVMDQMSSRGILNSDVTGNAMAREDMNLQDLLAGNVAGANTWAATQGQDYVKNKQDQERKGMLRTQDLNLDQMKSLPDMIAKMLQSIEGAQASNDASGKNAMGASSNYFDMVKQIMDF